MIKVLFLTNNLESGGAERVLVNLANELSKNAEYDVTIRCLVKAGPQLKRVSSRVKCEGVFERLFFYRGLNYLYLLPHSWIYKKVVGSNDYDIIIPYLHGVLTRIIAYAPASQKTIAYLHANMESSPFIKQIGSKEKIRKIFDNYNRIVAVSEDVKDSFIRISGYPNNGIDIIYNTFDVNEIRRLAGEPIDVVMDKNKLNICSVGKLEEVKGYKRLIKVSKRLKECGLNFHLYIVGDGVQREELFRDIDNNKLSDCITLIGYRSNPYTYINNCDFLVCSSFSEGFSSVVAESIILGTPVVTTDCAGMKEMLGRNNEYGMICSNDEDGLYNAMVQMITNQCMRENYEKKVLERAEFFKTSVTVKAVEKMIHDVLIE